MDVCRLCLSNKPVIVCLIHHGLENSKQAWALQVKEPVDRCKAGSRAGTSKLLRLDFGTVSVSERSHTGQSAITLQLLEHGTGLFRGAGGSSSPRRDRGWPEAWDRED